MSLYKQLRQGHPDNLAILKSVSLFSVNSVLKSIKHLPKSSKVMQCFIISGNILAKAESQLQCINLVIWNKKTEKKICGL